MLLTAVSGPVIFANRRWLQNLFFSGATEHRADIRALQLGRDPVSGTARRNFAASTPTPIVRLRSPITILSFNEDAEHSGYPGFARHFRYTSGSQERSAYETEKKDWQQYSFHEVQRAAGIRGIEPGI